MTPAPLLVFGDDGSTGADVAWLWVNNHPWVGWQIETVTGESADSTPALPDGEGLQEWTPPWDRSRVVPDGVESVRFLKGSGDPRVLLGDRGDAGLVVVGPRGLGHFRAVLAGSTSEWLLRHPPAPLAIIRSAAPVTSAVVCVDGSPDALEAARAFARLPLAAAASVTVLTVGSGVDESAGVDEAVEVLRGATDRVLAERLHGDPTGAISAYLAEGRPGLVVMGTRGLTGLERLRLGSTAASVVRNASCSSLVAGVAGSD